MATTAIVVWYASITVASPPQPDDALEADSSSTQAGIDLLADIKDLTFSFDDEGFYWFCRYLREHPAALSSTACGFDDVVPWQYLMERPSDYRGRAECVEGRVLREQPEYEVVSRPGVGRLRQVDLGTPGSSAIATLVLVDPPPSTPRKSLVRVRGFFIKVRSYRTESGDEGAGPLFVARTFDVVETARNGVRSESGVNSRDILTAMAGITFGLFLLVMMLRRQAAASATVPKSPADRPSVSGTPSDFEWMGEKSRESTPEDHSTRG